jgi:hypothetical protein
MSTGVLADNSVRSNLVQPSTNFSRTSRSVLQRRQLSSISTVYSRHARARSVRHRHCTLPPVGDNDCDFRSFWFHLWFTKIVSPVSFSFLQWLLRRCIRVRLVSSILFHRDISREDPFLYGSIQGRTFPENRTRFQPGGSLSHTRTTF